MGCGCEHGVCESRSRREEESMLVSCPINTISFAEVTLSRDREARRRRCSGIVDDERQGDRPKSPPPCGLRAQRPCFFVAPPRRCRASTRRHASNQKPFRLQQITCYLWDRTLQHRRRRTTKRSAARPMLPKGYRCRESTYFVPAPRRCQSIACVADASYLDSRHL